MNKSVAMFFKKCYVIGTLKLSIHAYTYAPCFHCVQTVFGAKFITANIRCTNHNTYAYKYTEIDDAQYSFDILCETTAIFLLKVVVAT